MSDERPVPHPFDYVSRDQVQDLWGIGYTIVRRSRHPDPFHVPPEMVPHTRSYQWWHLVEDKSQYQHSGWAAVPASRHDGYFMPFGTVGAIEVGGLGLFEKPKFEVDQERAAQARAAQQQVSDWAKKAGADGLSGSFSIDGQTFDVGESPAPAARDKKTKTINTTVGVPADMFPHLAEVFAERDRLYADMERVWNTDGAVYSDRQWSIYVQYQNAVMADPSLNKGPVMNALLLPWAIENVRAKLPTPMLDKLKALKEGKTDE